MENKPCNDCPFRFESEKGWVGPYKDGEHFLSELDKRNVQTCHCTHHLPNPTICRGWEKFKQGSNQVMNREEFINHHRNIKK